MAALAQLKPEENPPLFSIETLSAERVLIDCTDLLETLSKNTTVTGIDRVQIRLIEHLFGLAKGSSAGKTYLVYRSEFDYLKRIDVELVATLVRVIGQTTLDTVSIARTVTECRERASKVVAEPGDLYFVPGPFWSTSTTNRLVHSLKARGVVVGVYIYDLIPMTHPQFCESAHCDAFAAAFAETFPFIDFALTISEFVAQQLRETLARYQMPTIPIIPVPLAHDLETTVTSPVERTTLVKKLGGRPFVLCVGTIEARKNHLYLLNVWNTLDREGVDLPLLVLVGRLGWRVTDLKEQLQSLRYVNDTIKIFSDVSDADLASLYDRCLFTIFPSFVEGWGLPVGESLARGKIAVASSAASIPEVGGKFAVYIDPHNLHSGVDAVRRLLTDASYRESLEAVIRHEFRPRTWEEAGEDFLCGLEEGFATRTVRKAFSPLLRPGHFLTISELTDPACDMASYLRQPLRLILSEGWRPIDTGGSWIAEKHAVVKFDTGLPSGSKIALVMSFITVPWLTESALVISCASHTGREDSRLRSRRVLQPSVMFRQPAQAVVDDDGAVTLHFQIEGEPCANPPQEERKLWVRMLTIGWCDADDVFGRLSLLEQMVCA